MLPPFCNPVEHNSSASWACVFWATVLINPQWTPFYFNQVFSKILVSTVQTSFCCFWQRQTSKGNRSNCIWKQLEVFQAFPTKFLRLALPSVTWVSFTSAVMERGEYLFLISCFENLWPFFPWTQVGDICLMWSLLFCGQWGIYSE